MSAPTSQFPILRAVLQDRFSQVLNMDLQLLETHAEDANFVRNKVNNLSKNIIDVARLGRRNIQLVVPIDFCQEILSKLSENFPDVQFVVSNSTKQNLNIIKAFWT